MNLHYVAYRIFETKWKRRIFDQAIDELKKIPNQPEPLTLHWYLESQKHFDKSQELMDMII